VIQTPILNRLRAALSREPTVGAEDHHVDRVAVVVDPTVETTPWRCSQDKSERVEMRGLQDHGCGSLESDAWEAVKRQIDPDRVPEPTHVATLIVDYDEWDYRVEWTTEGKGLRSVSYCGRGT
jgi:hypothetical protein